MKSFVKIFVILSLFLQVKSYSQEFSFGPIIGATALTGNEIYTKPISENGYNFGGALTYGGKIKFRIPLTSIYINSTVLYSTFANEEDVTLTDIISSGNLEILKSDIEGSLLQGTFGAEMGLLPGPFQPVVSLDIVFSSFSKVENNIAVIEEIESRARFGLGLGAGIDLALSEKFSFDIRGKYYLANLIGKEENEKQVNSFNFLFSFLYTIN